MPMDGHFRGRRLRAFLFELGVRSAEDQNSFDILCELSSPIRVNYLGISAWSGGAWYRPGRRSATGRTRGRSDV